MGRLALIASPRGRARHDGAAGRLALAIAASAVLHAWLAGALAPGFPRPGARPAASSPLEARLQHLAAAVPEPAAAPVTAAVPLPRIDGPRVQSRQLRSAPRGHSLPPASSGHALPAAPDLTYYAASDLDAYPQPVAPLDFGRLAVGRFRFTLLIDEAGRVSAVQGETSQPALRAVLAATRFHPARRDGRAVRSRVQLELDLEREPRAP